LFQQGEALRFVIVPIAAVFANDIVKAIEEFLRSLESCTEDLYYRKEQQLRDSVVGGAKYCCQPHAIERM
jgi:hypothetical protein